jgi:hypothetical protein
MNTNFLHISAEVYNETIESLAQKYIGKNY